MGVQSSINQALGAAATAALGLEHIKNQDMEAAIKAKETAIKVAEEMPQLGEELESANKGMERVSADEEALNELAGEVDMTNPEEVKTFGEMHDKVMEDKKMAQRALDIVNGKISARHDLIRRSERQIRKARLWGGKK